MKTQICLYVTAVMIANSGLAQGTFVNLGFESANVTPLPPGQSEVVFTSNAVPGWTVFQNTTPIDLGAHNGFSGGTPFFSILGPFFQPPSQILDGSFTVVIAGSSLGNTDISIQQNGLIPAASRSIQFKAFGALESLGVFVNGGSLSPVPLSTTANYTVFGVDISPFANQTVDLRFTSFAPASGSGVRAILLDAIQFSGTSVPEPGTWALLGLGSALFWSTARRRRNERG